MTNLGWRLKKMKSNEMKNGRGTNQLFYFIYNLSKLCNNYIYYLFMKKMY